MADDGNVRQEATGRKNHDNDGLRKLCGCPRKRWSTCEHPYHFNFRWKGEGYRFTLERQVCRVIRRTTASGSVVWVRDLAALGEEIKGKTDAEIEADRLRAAIRA